MPNLGLDKHQTTHSMSGHWSPWSQSKWVSAALFGSDSAMAWRRSASIAVWSFDSLVKADITIIILSDHKWSNLIN